MKPSIYNYSYDELSQEIKNLGFNPHLTKTVFELLYKFKSPKAKQTPANLFTTLEQYFDFDLPKIVNVQIADDGTVKFLLELQDSKKVETVLIPFFKKYTICLSSQVGCAMNCSFCYTGKQGFYRHLNPAEIIGQYIVAFEYLKKNFIPNAPLPNIVFMGQGEPLHNFESLKKALDIFLHPCALHLGNRQITVSSAGYVPGLKRFNELNYVNLAISFHSGTNDIRSELIPLNQKYPIEILIGELHHIKLLKRQFITFEYLLIDGLNDRYEDALSLIEKIQFLKIIVNLIPFNPYPGSPYQRPSSESVMLFKTWLVANRIRTMVRTTKGNDILAACGQLNSTDQQLIL